ncbi:MAG: division/cell wall cluster transcriptional repressor MraZ [Paracoccaceae bacterium]
MSEAFRGEFNQKVDGKARVSIPAAFRRILEAGDPSFNESSRPRFVIVYGDERRSFLECYTISEMKKVEAQIARLPRGNPHRRLLERNLITLSLTAEVDEDGRIVLPAKARDKIALTADDLKDGIEATFAGSLDTFQIWKRDTYEADLSAKAEADLAALPDDVDILSLLGDAEPGV